VGTPDNQNAPTYQSKINMSHRRGLVTNVRTPTYGPHMVTTTSDDNVLHYPLYHHHVPSTSTAGTTAATTTTAPKTQHRQQQSSEHATATPDATVGQTQQQGKKEQHLTRNGPAGQDVLKLTAKQRGQDGQERPRVMILALILVIVQVRVV
jgi:cobalamin biosynthesis Mg chelatase CobN